MLTIEEQLEVLKNQLQGKIFLNHNNGGGLKQSKDYVIQERVAIQFLCMDTPKDNSLCVCIFLGFCKLNNKDKNSYRLKIRSEELKVDASFFASFRENDKISTWYLLHSKLFLLKSFDVKASVEVIEHQNTFPTIHDDTELTDFEMGGVDGSVRVHRAVLGAASPVLRRMLCGEWREGASGRVQLPDTTRETLQHFKDFVYLGALPESGLRPLLLLARYLMMPDLQGRCSRALADGLTADTTYELLGFAYSNNLPKLVKKILERVEMGKVQVADITFPSDTS